MKKNFKTAILSGFLALLLLPALAAGGEKITLVGGTMHPEGSVYWRTVVLFRDRLKEYYKGPAELEIDLHHSATLGSEKDAVEYMIQGTAVDFYIVSPSWAATWEKKMALIDAPFLFKSVEHWKKCMAQDVFKPLDEAIAKKGMRFIGHGGGGIRSIASTKPASSVKDFPNIRMRIQGNPLHQKVFAATGLVVAPLDFTEVYNAIKTGVMDALEGEPTGIETAKLYEVTKYYILTEHQITTRLLAMSEARFQSFPKDLQEAILKAGKEAGMFHWQTEMKAGEEAMKFMEGKGLKMLPFDNTEMRRLALPVVEAFAKEIGAEDIVKAIQAID